MFQILVRAALAYALLPAAAGAEPIKLKLSFYTSDRASTYQAGVKPFVEAVNAEGKDLINIEVYFSGAIDKSQERQPQLVLDGLADMAFIVPGMTPSRFPDNVVIEMPGLFRNMREATLTYTRLIAANALRGYEPFHVIGTYGSEPESFHMRPAVTGLDSLRNRTVRVNNRTEAALIEKLGMKPALMAINTIPEAISGGNLEGAMVPASMLFEFGIGRVVSNHYFLHVSSAPLALVMSRKSLERLPERAQAIIRKYSGEWAAARFLEARAPVENDVMNQLKSDKRRHVLFPSASDLQTVKAAFEVVAQDAVAKSEEHRKLLALAKAEVAKLRVE